MRYLKNGWKVTAFTLLLMQACSGPAKEKMPDNVLQEPKMRAVLQDILLAEAYVADLGYSNQDSIKPVVQKMYLQIFQKHGVKREDFFSSMNYYTRHPNLLNDDFQPIIDSLSVLEAEAMQ